VIAALVLRNDADEVQRSIALRYRKDWSAIKRAANCRSASLELSIMQTRGLRRALSSNWPIHTGFTFPANSFRESCFARNSTVAFSDGNLGRVRLKSTQS